MESVTLRKGVLPFAVLDTRLSDRHHDIAELIDVTLCKIHRSTDLEAILSSTGIVTDLEQALDCLCYVGFRRAQFVSAKRFASLVEEILASPEISRTNPLSGLKVRYLMTLLGLCRARFDTLERGYFADACLEILRLLLAHGYEHVTVQHTHTIIKWFMHTARIQPARHDQFIALSVEFGRRYFDSGEQLFPLNKMKDRPHQIFLKKWHHFAVQKLKRINNPGHNVVMEVAIATAIGRRRYAYDAISYLRTQRSKTEDKAIRQRLETRMVDVAYVASHDEVYGDWSPLLRKYLLNNHFHTFSHYITATLMRFGRYPRAEKELSRRRRVTLRARNEEALLYRYTS
ncbi:hypothetical protein LP421_16970 [Rhizobium sp. RCAM05350]|nr:hypothetical protein LP421_16970 [Rhizobium sp. RCAM05350]